MSLKSIIDRKFHEESKLKYNDELKELHREAWLAETGRSERDVMMDESGTEYVFIEEETEFGEEYKVEYKKIILPRELQTFYADI